MQVGEYQGAYKVRDRLFATSMKLWCPLICVLLQITRGLLQKHGSMRVRDTPITEVRALPVLLWLLATQKGSPVIHPAVLRKWPAPSS